MWVPKKPYLILPDEERFCSLMPQRGMMAAAGGVSVPATVVYKTELNGATGTPYQWTSVGLGTATDRTLVVLVINHRGSTLTSAKIDTVDTNQAVVANAGLDFSEIRFLTGVTGTDCTIDVVVSAGDNNISVGVYSVYNSAVTVSDTDSDTAADPLTCTALTIPVDGVGIGGAIDDTATTHTWAELSENYETNPSSSTRCTGAATDTVEGTPTITCDPTASSTANAMTVAAFAAA
jgi:hypothetical protein